MIEVDGVVFSGFLTAEDVNKKYSLTKEKLENCVKEGLIKPFCIPSGEHVFSKKAIEAMMIHMKKGASMSKNAPK